MNLLTSGTPEPSAPGSKKTNKKDIVQKIKPIAQCQVNAYNHFPLFKYDVTISFLISTNVIVAIWIPIPNIAHKNPVNVINDQRNNDLLKLELNNFPLSKVYSLTVYYK